MNLKFVLIEMFPPIKKILIRYNCLFKLYCLFWKFTKNNCYTCSVHTNFDVNRHLSTGSVLAAQNKCFVIQEFNYAIMFINKRTKK